MKRSGFHFHDAQQVLAQQTLEGEISEALETYLSRVLGRQRHEINELVRQELTREISKYFISDLDKNGVPFRNRSVLDLGAGLGALSFELASAGANVVSVEPGEVWRNIARRRVGTKECQVVGAVGEHLPFKDNSFDLIMSLWVLEHVQDPDTVLRECFRVCRPGGFFVFTCENYLSFREKHYGIFWLPLMPRPLARLYLKMRGRSPKFLEEAVTYTNSISVASGVRKSGFRLLREQQIAQRLDAVDQIANPARRKLAMSLKKILGRHLAGLVPVVLAAENLSRIFTAGIEYWLYKPLFDAHSAGSE